MDQLWTLAILSVSMFTGCYVSGSIPLVLSLSEKVLRRVTVLGAGLLVGTALTVIIPEGVESLFAEHYHGRQTPSVHVMEPKQQEAREVVAGLSLEEGEGYNEEQLQFLFGLSLVLGFVFMLVVDQIGSGHAHALPTSDPEVGGGGGQRRGNLTATIGLVVHAAADGLALGAAAGLSKTDVEMVIFLAIMLHKAPAAFGFTTFLIHEGYDRQTAKCHLLVFSLAAPVAAFLSYFGLVRIMYVIEAPVTGITMLFSAGTFLYVATVHVLTEVTHKHLDTSDNSSHKLSLLELILLSTGTFLPLVFNIFHSH